MKPATGVHLGKQFSYAGVVEMVRVTCAYFVVFGSAIAGLVFGTEAIRLLIAVLLTLGVWPLWTTIRRALEAAAEQRGYINALQWAQSHLQQADD